MIESIALGPGPADSPHLDQPALATVVAHPEHLPDWLVRPLVRIEGGAIRSDLAGLPLCVFAHEVGLDSLEWRIEADGRYTLLDYNGVQLDDPLTSRAVLEAHLTVTYDSLEDFEEEMEETFDDIDDPSPLAVGTGDRVGLAIGSARWRQFNDEPEPPEQADFAFALDSHPHLFGCYYLFVDVARRHVRQVFQCT